MALSPTQYKGLPPRSNGANPTTSFTSTSVAHSPYNASPRTTKHTVVMKQLVATANASAAVPSSVPKRPMSASRVAPTSASISQSTHAPGYSRSRPASASKARLATGAPPHQSNPNVGVETIASPSKGIEVASTPTARDPTGVNSPPRSTPNSPRAIAKICQRIHIEQQKPPVPMHSTEKAKLRAFLASWQEEEPSFRSSILFSETTFAQAKAMVAEFPRPNAFLSAIAYGSLEQVGFALEKQYPFLSDVISELLEQQLGCQPTSHERNRFLLYFEHGKHWFQELVEQKHRNETLQFTTAASKDEIQRLSEKLKAHQVAQVLETMHKNNSASSTSKGSATTRAAAEVAAAHEDAFNAWFDPGNRSRFRFPQLRNLLYVDDHPVTGKLDFQPGDYDFWPCCEEILLVFQSLPPKEALKILCSLMEKAGELGLPVLGETYAVAVDLLDERERRQFLREYFRLVAPNELQDALQERDECNDEKRWQMFVDELKDRLGLALDGESEGAFVASTSPTDLRGKSAVSAKKLERFHTNEAKIGAKVHEMMDLLEDLAAEASLLDGKQSGLSSELMNRLREYENPLKRVEKARELMTNASNNKNLHISPASTTMTSEPKHCGCHCGKHRLIHEDDEVARPTAEVIEEQDGEGSSDAKKRNSSSRKSISKRPLSAKRKNAVSFGNRLSSPRNSVTAIRMFPLSEVCHLLSAILHLKFSRDATEASAAIAAGGGKDPTPILLMEDRWSFLRRNPKLVTFKTLAKDYLVRKYGIKSIAVMHTMQLERSLVHYSAIDKHIRSELFAWFLGADKLRLQSKDHAFQFFQRLVKHVMGLFTKKPSVQLSFSTLISVWTEYIGDGESSSGALVRYLTPAHAVDACNLSFPVRMKEASEYAGFLERLYRLGLDRDQVELETFFKKAMEVWQIVFDRMVSEVLATLDAGCDEFDFDAFTRILVRNDLELTGGERLEIFDLLSLEDDESVVTKKKLLNFILETKYLRSSG